jgi:hypothetical protein
MNKQQHPKNVLAIFDWYRQNAPDSLATVMSLFPLPVGVHPTIEEIDAERRLQPFQALLLQGFEAGRQFQIEHPTVKSGSEGANSYFNG